MQTILKTNKSLFKLPNGSHEYPRTQHKPLKLHKLLTCFKLQISLDFPFNQTIFTIKNLAKMTQKFIRVCNKTTHNSNEKSSQKSTKP